MEHGEVSSGNKRQFGPGLTGVDDVIHLHMPYTVRSAQCP